MVVPQPHKLCVAPVQIRPPLLTPKEELPYYVVDREREQMSILNKPVLVLNKSWLPVRIATLEKALSTLFREDKTGNPKARIIDPADYTVYTWEDWRKLEPLNEKDLIKGVNQNFRLPKVILLEYNSMHNKSVKFSRRMLYRRDDYTCQYCAKHLPTEELNIDHVIPRSQGGITTWENLVVSCVNCNSKKANRTPEQANMKLIRKPFKPRWSIFQNERRRIEPEWEKFISEIYWEVPLENDEK